MRNLVRGMAAYGALVASAAWLSTARADTVATTDAAWRTGPNTGLISSGFITFGVPYVTSVIIASQSNHEGDKNLYMPVAGPWIDLANRGGCDGINQPTCATETGYKVLLAADGLLQTVGAVEIFAGLLIPERHATTVAKQPTVHVAPSPVGQAGMGLAAVGRF
jgi:hypothetical protein